jgi:hypothetical protein
MWNSTNQTSRYENRKSGASPPKKNGVDPLKYGPTKTMSEATKVGDSANAQPKRNGQVVDDGWLRIQQDLMAVAQSLQPPGPEGLELPKKNVEKMMWGRPKIRYSMIYPQDCHFNL